MPTLLAVSRAFARPPGFVQIRSYSSNATSCNAIAGSCYMRQRSLRDLVRNHQHSVAIGDGHFDCADQSFAAISANAPALPFVANVVSCFHSVWPFAPTARTGPWLRAIGLGLPLGGRFFLDFLALLFPMLRHRRLASAAHSAGVLMCVRCTFGGVSLIFIFEPATRPPTAQSKKWLSRGPGG